MSALIALILNELAAATVAAAAVMPAVSLTWRVCYTCLCSLVHVTLLPAAPVLTLRPCSLASVSSFILYMSSYDSAHAQSTVQCAL
jgi:hypothetical protein